MSCELSAVDERPVSDEAKLAGAGRGRLGDIECFQGFDGTELGGQGGTASGVGPVDLPD